MPESIFTSQTPTSGDNVEPGGIVTAVSFTPAVDGTITGIRFYASATVGGTYTGQLYLPTSDDDPAGSGTGTLLGTKVAPGAITPAGWNVIAFDTPIPVTGGSTYRATLHNTQGRYVSTNSFTDFANGIGLTNGNLHAIWNGEPIPALGGDTLTQGTFAPSATPIYPSNTFNAGNYFVDVVFQAGPAEGAAAFTLDLALASTGESPGIPMADGVADFGIEIALSAVGETPVAGQGSAAFTLNLALAGAGSNEPASTVRCGWEGIDPGELGLCDDWSARPAGVRNAALSLAADYLWAATGRRFGVCPVTISPRQSRGAPVQYQAFPVWPGSSNGGEWPTGPFLFAGRWFNAGSGIACCGDRGCAVVLPGPAVDVRQVMMDGEVVSPSAYRLDVSGGAYLLVRTDGGCWPACSDDFTVTYGIGRPLTSSLVTAVALLACEYAKGLTGGDCKLPAQMTRLSRQGVDIELEQVDGTSGVTGIREVDDLIAALNPSKRQSPPVLLSPDLPGAHDRMTIWP